MDVLTKVDHFVDPTVDEFLISILICAMLIVGTVAVFYESMRFVWHKLSAIPHRPRLAIHLGVLTVFFAHTMAVWMYAMTYWILVEKLGFGSLLGQFEKEYFLTYVYFSVTTYSSLGYGDIFPEGPLRIITGVEAVNGLILIGWSTTYTYFAAERYMAHERALKGQERRNQDRRVNPHEL